MFALKSELKFKQLQFKDKVKEGNVELISKIEEEYKQKADNSSNIC
jgi:hypothetical protein